MGRWLEALLASRWVVLASPVYFYGFPGPAKDYIDRCQPLWARKRRPPGGGGPLAISPPGRKGFLVAAGASRGKNLFLGLELTARTFFDAIDVAYAGSYAVRGLDSAGDAARMPAALKGAREAGRSLFRS
jgi:multimeric flavodoxin WrbA